MTDLLNGLLDNLGDIGDITSGLIPDLPGFELDSVPDLNYSAFDLATLSEDFGLANLPEEFGPVIENLKEVLSEEAIQILEGEATLADVQAFAALAGEDEIFASLLTELGDGNSLSDLFSDPAAVQSFIDGTDESEEESLLDQLEEVTDVIGDVIGDTVCDGLIAAVNVASEDFKNATQATCEAAGCDGCNYALTHFLNPLIALFLMTFL